MTTQIPLIILENYPSNTITKPILSSKKILSLNNNNLPPPTPPPLSTQPTSPPLPTQPTPSTGSNPPTPPTSKSQPTPPPLPTQPNPSTGSNPPTIPNPPPLPTPAQLIGSKLKTKKSTNEQLTDKPQTNKTTIRPHTDKQQIPVKPEHLRKKLKPTNGNHPSQGPKPGPHKSQHSKLMTNIQKGKELKKVNHNHSSQKAHRNNTEKSITLGNALKKKINSMVPGIQGNTNSNSSNWSYSSSDSE